MSQKFALPHIFHSIGHHSFLLPSQDFWSGLEPFLSFSFNPKMPGVQELCPTELWEEHPNLFPDSPANFVLFSPFSTSCIPSIPTVPSKELHCPGNTRIKNPSTESMCSRPFPAQSTGMSPAEHPQLSMSLQIPDLRRNLSGGHLCVP